MPLSGTTGAVLVGNAGAAAWHLTADGTNVYWASGTSSGRPVFFTPLSGSAPPIQLWDTNGQTLAIRAGGPWLYFRTNSSSIFRTPKP
jgi:hypothetical protein